MLGIIRLRESQRALRLCVIFSLFSLFPSLLASLLRYFYPRFVFRSPRKLASESDLYNAALRALMRRGAQFCHPERSDPSPHSFAFRERGPRSRGILAGFILNFDR